MSDNDNKDNPSGGMQDYAPQDADDTDDGETPEDVSTDGSDIVEDKPPKESEGQEITQPDDTFADNFDPKKIAPELMPAYKQMQADYTRKTQGIAKDREFAARYQEYQPFLDYVAKNPDALDRVLATGESKVEQADVPQDPVEYAKWVKEMTIKEMRTEFAEKEQQRTRQDAINRDIDQAEKLDPRLNEDPDFARMVAGMVLADADVQSGHKNYVTATKDAIALYDNKLRKVISDEKVKMTQQAKDKRNPKVTSSPADTVEPGRKPKSMQEAAKMAGFL